MASGVVVAFFGGVLALVSVSGISVHHLVVYGGIVNGCGRLAHVANQGVFSFVWGMVATLFPLGTVWMRGLGVLLG